ncbi:MAG: aminotransferase class I/II-fold pyridoxal phosphate-dependent enzyme [Methyloligellaceae bacterium]
MSLQESPYIEYIAQRKRDDLTRSLVNCEHPGPGRISIDGREYANFSTNDYLGLAHHPVVIERVKEWADKYGAGSESSRLVTGNITPFHRVEQKIAKLKGAESALIFPSGFQANASILQALLNKQILGAAPLVFADRLNHASMHFGCAAAGARQIRYRHLDMDHLSQLLEKHKDNKAPKFFLTESVFSMDGDIAPMDVICDLARRYNCLTICDDAHATGILGENGKGLSGDADIVVGTFSKAMGSIGAYVTSSNVIRDFLIHASTGLIYSTALPPMVLGAVDAALDLLPELDKEREKVTSLAKSFRKKVKALGFDTGGSASQIVPVMAGESEKALLFSDRLKESGYWATAIRPPTVPKGTARLRFTFCPAHDQRDIDGVVEVISRGTGHHV